MKNDLVGKRFGKLTVLSKTDEKKNGSYLYKCKCDCGNIKMATARDLGSKRVQSCGCSKGFHRNLVGQRFGKLTVIEDFGEKQKNVRMWTCKCDCGNIVNVRTDSLTGGKVVSCGCGKKSEEKAKQLLSGRNIVDHTSEVFFKGTISKNNHTGVNGVCLSKGRYIAYIGYKGKTYRLLTTTNFDKAVQARKEAEQHIFKDFEEWYGEWKTIRK